MASRAWTPNASDWQVAKPFEQAADFARELRVSPLIASLLHNRGIDAAEAGRAFLDPKLTDLHDPSELAGCDAAAGRILAAMKAGRRIVLYGDYDVDGITGVATLYACLELVRSEGEGYTGEVDFYVPHRIDEGYGLNATAVDKLIADGTEMIVTVDCGVSAADEIARATAAGVDVIITDHHSLPETLPDACEIVHPLLTGGDGQPYPNPNLCGAGVAFKLAWQVAREACGRTKVTDALRNFLLDATSMVALGTIADVVPLVGENRVLAKYGLQSLPSTKHPGLRALLESSNLLGETLDAYHVGFRLAPQINAAGRMGHARLAVELLTRAETKRAKEIAQYLSVQNSQRQKVQREIAAEAVEMIESRGLDAPDRRTIVLGAESWHGGVIGIVASRIVEKFSRPALLVAFNGATAQGSGRSVPGFDMHAALTACGEHLVSFGGHAMAGGIRIEPARLDAFAEAMEQYAREHFTEAPTMPTLRVDAEADLADLDYPTVERIRRLAPFGQGNPPPVIALRACRVITPPKQIGKTGRTITMVLGDAKGKTTMRAVGFNMGELLDHCEGINVMDVAAEPVLNTFRGRTSVELQLKDVKW